MADDSEDMISLEDLVRSTDDPNKATSTTSSEAGAADGSSPTTTHASAAAPLDPARAIDQLDSVLAKEDPAFLEAMTELKASAAAEEVVEVEIEALDPTAFEIAPLGRAAVPFYFKRPKLALRTAFRQIFAFVTWASGRIAAGGIYAATTGRKSAIAKLKAGLTAIAGFLKAGIAKFKALDRRSKLVLFSVILLGTATLFVVKTVVQGHVLPSLQARFLTSFADVADAKFAISENEPLEDFADPLYNAEHVVAINKVVVNLRRLDERANPMGLFEFFIEASTNEGAVEIRDRESEIRDLMARTLEQMPYDELNSVDGKTKIKTILRKELNELLSTGRIRRIYLKTMVIKP